MAEPKEITVSWPPLALGTDGWLRRLEDLAADAELLVGRKQIGLQETASMALQLVGLIWPALSPETIAASCRASALLGVPVVMSSAPADQVQEVAERLDAIYASAQSDPAAGLVEVPAPLLQRVVPPDPRIGKRQRKAEPEPEPADHQIELEPITQVVAADHPVELAESPDPVAADHPAEPEPITQLGPFVDEDGDFSRVRNALPIKAIDTIAEGGALPDSARAAPTPPTPAADVPAAWLLAADVAELLNISTVTVSRWRIDGRLGVENTDWLPSGRSYAFEPGMIELVMDQQAAKKQARTERKRPRVGDQRPPGWLTCDELARAAIISGSKARQLVRHGGIPPELVLRIGRRSQWINPDAVELLQRTA